jgi:hypothetical protein
MNLMNLFYPLSGLEQTGVSRIIGPKGPLKDRDGSA